MDISVKTTDDFIHRGYNKMIIQITCTDCRQEWIFDDKTETQILYKLLDHTAPDADILCPATSHKIAVIP